MDSLLASATTDLERFQVLIAFIEVLNCVRLHETLAVRELKIYDFARLFQSFHPRDGARRKLRTALETDSQRYSDDSSYAILFRSWIGGIRYQASRLVQITGPLSTTRLRSDTTSQINALLYSERNAEDTEMYSSTSSDENDNDQVDDTHSQAESEQMQDPEDEPIDFDDRRTFLPGIDSITCPICQENYHAGRNKESPLSLHVSRYISTYAI